MSEMHISEVTDIVNGITDENEGIIYLTVGRAQDYPSDNNIDETIIIEELAEMFRASLVQHLSWTRHALNLQR